jgi:hypothetical protein
MSEGGPPEPVDDLFGRGSIHGESALRAAVTH